MAVLTLPTARVHPQSAPDTGIEVRPSDLDHLEKGEGEVISLSGGGRQDVTWTGTPTSTSTLTFPDMTLEERTALRSWLNAQVVLRDVYGRVWIGVLQSVRGGETAALLSARESPVARVRAVFKWSYEEP